MSTTAAYDLYAAKLHTGGAAMSGSRMAIAGISATKFGIIVRTSSMELSGQPRPDQDRSRAFPRQTLLPVEEGGVVDYSACSGKIERLESKTYGRLK